MDDNEEDDRSTAVHEEENGEFDDLGVLDNNDEEEIDDEPVGEGEGPPPPKPEPSYALANAYKFYTFCMRLEFVWQKMHGLSKPLFKSQKQKDLSDEDKLGRILPKEYLEQFDAHSKCSDKPESIFPIFRLLMPDRDSSRQCNVKESTIARMYADAFGLWENSDRYKMLVNYRDDRFARNSAGDFPSVVMKVVAPTKLGKREDHKADWTVGDINAALDEFDLLSQKTRMASNHEIHSKKRKANCAWNG